MQPMPNPKPTDDPHDVLVVAPGVAVMVPTDEELAQLAYSLRHPPYPQAPALPQDATEADFPQATVPRVDTTFRPAAVGDVRGVDRPPTALGKAARALAATLVVAAIGGVFSIGWQSFGDAAETMITRWAPQRVLAWLPLEKSAPAAQPVAPAAAEASAANADPAPAAAAAENTAQGTAPAAPAATADAPQSPDSTASQLASARQEIEQLKATIEELKASQQQMSRDTARDARVSDIKGSLEVRAPEARVSEVRPTEQNLRPKTPARPPRTAAPRAHKPMPPPPLQQATTAPMLPQAAPPYAPRPIEPPPQTTGVTLTDPELAQVPRPPMPVR